MNECFYKDGLNFECQRCSHCCKDEPGFVYLSKIDLKNLLLCYNIPKEDFIEKYCRFVPYYDGSEVLCLQEKENYECILWNNGCSAYKNKPIQCSTYPFWSHILSNKKNWDAESSECKGINKGNLCSFSQIEFNKDLYENNFPLRKGEL